MAFNKEQKSEMVARYEGWLKKSQALFVLEYSKMNMRNIDTLRVKVRDAGGEIHVVKNTLMYKAMQNAGYQSVKQMEKSSIVGFAFNDPPALAKIFTDATKNSEIFKIKGGFLTGQYIKIEDVRALAELPPLPVLRAKLLGTIQAPASQLVRTLAEPARMVAAVIKAYSEKESAPAVS